MNKRPKDPDIINQCKQKSTTQVIHPLVKFQTALVEAFKTDRPVIIWKGVLIFHSLNYSISLHFGVEPQRIYLQRQVGEETEGPRQHHELWQTKIKKISFPFIYLFSMNCTLWRNG